MFAVNCVGDIVENGKIIAGARKSDGSGFADSEVMIVNSYAAEKDLFSGNTVLGCIMTNAKLTKEQASRLAGRGQDAIAKAVRPAHSIYDGDTVFALASGKVEASLDAVGVLAERASVEAIWDAVKSAQSFEYYVSYKDIMAVDQAYQTAGTIGGGCSEASVLLDAYHIIGTGMQRCVEVDLSNDIAAEEGMACGGKMKVLIQDVSAGS